MGSFSLSDEYASLETGVPQSDFPQTCPYFFEQASE
jgi:hypothetical protein